MCKRCLYGWYHWRLKKNIWKKIIVQEMVNIIHMSFFHGLESAMNAGRDLAIGDFIYEFDTAYVDYPSELIMEVYDKLLEGNDIVSAGTRDHVRMTSGFFYFLLQ